MRKFLTLALWMVAAIPLEAQELWTLEDCINYAVSNNIEVKKSALEVEQKEVALSTAKNSMLPALGASGSQNFSFGRGLTSYNVYANTNTTATSFSLGGEMPLFTGLKIKNNIELSKLNLQAAAEDLEKIKNDIRTAVAEAFVQILYNKEILGVAQRQVEIDSLQVARLEGMHANGKASASEVSAQKATMSQSMLTAVKADNSLKLSILDLTQLLELSSPEKFDVALPDASALEIHLLDSPDDIFEIAIGIKPQIRSEQFRLDAAKSSIGVAKADYYPTLSLNGGLGTNYYTNSLQESDPFFDQLKTNFSQYVGLSLSIPIFQRFAVRNNVRSARLSYSTQELQLDNAKKKLFKEIQQAYYNAVASQSKYASSSQAAESARESFVLMEAKYENGKATLTEFNESKGRYLEAESNLVQAKYEYLYLSKLLDFYKGNSINF